MPLDPKCKLLLELLSPPEWRSVSQMSVAEARAQMERMVALRPPCASTAHIESRTLPGPLGEIPVRVYRPASRAPLPVLVYLHGGGWVIGSLDSHEGVCRMLAELAGCLVVSVDYRLAPEHKFPAPLEDCYAALSWVAANAASLGGDPERIAIGGDSAGGTLSAAVALLSRDRGGPRLVHQLLVYPATDVAGDTASYAENGEGYFLTRSDMQWFWGHYLASRADGESPYASPLRAPDLGRLPPATVLTAEFDPLRDEGEAYATRLEQAGIPTRLVRYDGVIHGFFGMTELLDQSKQALGEAAGQLRRWFDPVR